MAGWREEAIPLGASENSWRQEAQPVPQQDMRRGPNETVEAYRARIGAAVGTMPTPSGTQQMNDNALSSIRQSEPPPPPPGMMETFADAAKAFAGGYGRGVTSLADTAAAAFPVNMAINAAQMAKTAYDGGGVLNTIMAGLPDPNIQNLASDATRGAIDYQGQTTAGQYAGTVGEFLPGGIASKAPIIAGVVPGLLSEFAGQQTEGTQLEPWARAAAATVAPIAGQALRYPGSAVRALYGTGNPSSERQAFGGLLDNLNVPMTAGQRVGNESILRREMLTGPGQRIADQQTEAFTRAILGTIGEQGSRATPAVIKSAGQRIGQVFDDVQNGVDVAATFDVATRATAISGSYAESVSQQSPIIRNIATKFEDAATSPTGGTVSASDVARWRSILGGMVDSPDPATREAAVAMREVIDDALQQTLTAAGRADDVARLVEARGQYRNFLAVVRAASGAGSDTAEGLLSPSAIRNAVATQGRTAYATGTRGDIADIARAGESILRKPANSGTPAGLAAYNIPEIMSAGVGGGLGSALDLGTLGTAGTTIAALMAPAAYRSLGMTGFVQNAIINGGPGLLQPKYLSSLSGLLASQP